MSKGYQLIDLYQLDYFAGNPKYFDFAVAIFHWIIQELHVELGERLSGVEIDVIAVTYFGSYPSLGIHYVSETQDIGKLVEVTIRHIVQHRSVLDLITFITASGVDWKEITAKVMTPPLPDSTT